jgi:putative Holliday junction resolvase
MRILAIDPGEKRIGLALSDPTGTIASPHSVIKHISRGQNAARIAALAREHGCDQIVIGQALNWEGKPTESSRRAVKLAAALRSIVEIPVVLWDESGSTKTAQEAYRNMGISKKKRSGHLDEIAATVILQDYIENGKDRESAQGGHE